MNATKDDSNASAGSGAQAGVRPGDSHRPSAGGFVARVWTGWNADSGPLLAAGLAFIGALAASPLVIIGAAASRTLGGKSVTTSDVYDPIARVLGAKTASTVAKTVTHSAAAQGGAPYLQILALAFAVFAALSLFLQFRTMLDIVFQEDRPTTFGGWMGDMIHSAVAVAAVGAVVAITSLASRVATGASSAATRAGAISPIRIIAVLVLIALIPVAYRYLARHHMSWGAAMIASLVMFVVAGVATLLASFYFQSGTATKVYGPEASIFVALLWLLMLGIGLVAGAEVACVWQHARTGGSHG
jgi:uncharacterized BrkB/YihY/UPF0761 family membrane protein